MDTWLSQDDLERIWNVVHGIGIPENTTAKELAEFQRLIDEAIKNRVLN